MKLHEPRLSEKLKQPKGKRIEESFLTYIDYLKKSDYSKSYKEICIKNYHALQEHRTEKILPCE